LKAKDVVVLGVSKDTCETQKKFGESCGADFPLLSDAGGNLHALLNVGGKLPRRVTILIDKNGVVKKIDTAVKVNTHGKDVADIF
jgi:peroxiredoxin Q/BCP